MLKSARLEYARATLKNMYVSPRPTDSLKSLPTQKFLFESLIDAVKFLNTIQLSPKYYREQSPIIGKMYIVIYFKLTLVI